MIASHIAFAKCSEIWQYALACLRACMPELRAKAGQPANQPAQPASSLAKPTGQPAKPASQAPQPLGANQKPSRFFLFLLCCIDDFVHENLKPQMLYKCALKLVVSTSGKPAVPNKGAAGRTSCQRNPKPVNQ